MRRRPGNVAPAVFVASLLGIVGMPPAKPTLYSAPRGAMDSVRGGSAQVVERAPSLPRYDLSVTVSPTTRHLSAYGSVTLPAQASARSEVRLTLNGMMRFRELRVIS